MPTIAPELLESYERVEPGLGQRVLLMTEAEAAHRRDLQRRDLEAQIRMAEFPHRLACRAQWCAASVVVLVFLFAGLLLLLSPGESTTEVSLGAIRWVLIVAGVAFVGGRAAEALRWYLQTRLQARG